ncbi:gas vesicle accessory protein GvpU [Marinomonas sp.]|uniref:gas vesicle accessory protein GvpU n=1 Tax=Marinomonas sp. TaxID=1904862 RepID=UPI003BAAFCED
MTEKSQVSATDTIKKPDQTQPDWYLQQLVDMINGKEYELPITLFVNGLIVSGQLTSGHNYFEGLGEQLTEFFGGPSDDTSKAVALLTAPADMYTNDDEDEEKPLPQYIHLNKARVFTPGQQPIPSEGSWWRGRLSSVDGFHFGSLSALKEL